jgi:hypothetical protein
MFDSVNRIERTADNVRTDDVSFGGDSKGAGCAHVDVRGTVSTKCIGPPDMEIGGDWYCVDHINEHLCCGHRLSPEQRAHLLAQPERDIWMVRQRNLAEAEAKKLGDFDKQFPSTINDPDDHAFSWREHQMTRQRGKKK